MSGIEAAVCQDIADRQQKGIRKYGVTLEQNPAELRARLQHAYEECLDQALYLKWAMAKLDASGGQKHSAEVIPAGGFTSQPTGDQQQE